MGAPYEKHWIDYHQSVKRASPHTVKSYKISVKQYRQFLRSRKKCPLTATFADVIAFAASIDAAPATVRAKLAAVRSLHQFMLAIGARDCDPAIIVSGPKKRDSDRTRAYMVHTPEQVELVRAQLTNPAQRAAYCLMYDCALRVASCASFERAGLCLIEWKVSAIIKGGKLHSIPVWNPAARRDLLNQWERTAGERFLLPGRTGAGHLHTATLNRWVHEAAIAAGLDETEWSPHSLRHSRSDQLRHSLDPFERQAFLGHARLDETATYTRAELDYAPVIEPLPQTLARTLPDVFAPKRIDAPRAS